MRASHPTTCSMWLVAPASSPAICAERSRASTRARRWWRSPRGRDGVDADEWQEGQLTDGSRHRVYKRYFTAAGLADELGGGTVLMAGRWFVAVAA